MAIIIPDIDMPQNCNECPFSSDIEHKLYCSLRSGFLSGEYVGEYKDKRHPDCTLEEV